MALERRRDDETALEVVEGEVTKVWEWFDGFQNLLKLEVAAAVVVGGTRPSRMASSNPFCSTGGLPSELIRATFRIFPLFVGVRVLVVARGLRLVALRRRELAVAPRGEEDPSTLPFFRLKRLHA